MIYHLLDESEAFSEINGGAISRWAANMLRNRSETIICPEYDSTWGFPEERLYCLPGWASSDPIHPLLYRIPWAMQKAYYLRLFRPLLERLQPGDLLYTHNRPESAAVLASVAPQRGFKVVLHMHNSHLKRANAGQIEALQNARIVFCSKFLQKEIDACLPGRFKQTRIVYNGADANLYYPAQAKAAGVAHIVFTGRLIASKGVHVLVKAMSLLRERGVQARCTVVGASGFGKSRETRYTRRLKERVADNVVFAGYRSGAALAEILRNSDIYCCPSIWNDPFPLSPIEAMATGLPVVASNVGGIPEQFAFGGGSLVPPKDSVALANALQTLVEDSVQRRQMGLDALEAFRSHFLWDVVRRQYQEVVDEICA